MIRLVNIAFIIGLIVLFSCKENYKGNGLREGMVEYKITYLENNMSRNIPTNLLPSKMFLRFKNDKSIISISGIMGLFELRILNDHKRKQSTSLLTVMQKKYYYESETNDQSFCFKEIPGMVVESRKGFKEIAGTKCKRGRVIFPDTDMEPFIFYYTEEISIKNPTYDNPYSDIDGVLMKFQIKLNKLRMEVEALNVTPSEIDNSEFAIPPGFKKVKKKDMEEILNTLME
jgi:hypothetical protein